MASTIKKTAELGSIPFPIPGATSEKLTARIFNLDIAQGPVFVTLTMAAGARIPAHHHEKTAEQIYVLSGDFVDNGIAYGPGTFISQSVGQKHGPHETRGGCEVIFLQVNEVDPTDFFIDE